MGRGLGDVQRKVIEACRAKATVWDTAAGLALGVAHDAERPGLRNSGKTWRIGGQPYWEGQIVVASMAEYVQAQKEYRAVWPKSITLTQQIEAAVLPVDAAFNAIYPDLFGPSRTVRKHRREVDEKRWGLPTCAIRHAFDDDDKRRFRVARSTIHRAFKSLADRALTTVTIGVDTQKNAVDKTDRWEAKREAHLLSSPWRSAVLALDPRATIA